MTRDTSAPWGTVPTIAEASRAISEGSLSPVGLLEVCLARIQEREAGINAFLQLDEAGARAAAARCEREIADGHNRGPLHGIPLGVKDLIDVAGLRTTANSRVRLNYPVASRHAAAWASLESAGAVLVGKLALHEFALGGSIHDLPWPPARNPWDRTLGINGSSSGSAAAVAAGFVLGALGTDTGGSIRAPALCCGIAGMKTAAGAVPSDGVFPLSPTLDVIGPMARNAEDCEILYDALAGSSTSHQPRSAIPTLRIGVPRRWIAEECPPAPAIAAAFETALVRLARSGAEVLDISLPPMSDFASALTVIMLAQAWAVHEQDLKLQYRNYGMVARCRLMSGGLIKDTDYLAARRLQAVLIHEVANAMSGVDIVLTPAAAALAQKIESPTTPHALLSPSYVRPFSLTGHPCLVSPVAGTGNPMPIGVQSVCRPGNERMLFDLGRFIDARSDDGSSPQ